MLTLSALFHTYAPASSERSPHLPASHHKALDAIGRCRTGADGSRLSACARCGPPHHIAHAWGQRPCPPWPQQHAAPWLPNQLAPQLPGASFLLTCTVPDALRPLCRSHPRRASPRL